MKVLLRFLKMWFIAAVIMTVIAFGLVGNLDDLLRPGMLMWPLVLAAVFAIPFTMDADVDSATPP